MSETREDAGRCPCGCGLGATTRHDYPTPATGETRERLAGELEQLARYAPLAPPDARKLERAAALLRQPPEREGEGPEFGRRQVADYVERAFCRCHDDYVDRELVDPTCMAHDFADFLRNASGWSDEAEAWLATRAPEPSGEQP